MTTLLALLPIARGPRLPSGALLTIAAGARRAASGWPTIAAALTAGARTARPLPVATMPGGAAGWFVAVVVTIAAGATLALRLAIASRRRAVAAGAVVRPRLAVARSHADFEFNDLIPLFIAAVAFRDGK
ncbi:MAG: hypothetical protein WAZ34_04015 [Rhodocyclaceae bacterium]